MTSAWGDWRETRECLRNVLPEWYRSPADVDADRSYLTGPVLRIASSDIDYVIAELVTSGTWHEDRPMVSGRVSRECGDVTRWQLWALEDVTAHCDLPPRGEWCEPEVYDVLEWLSGFHPSSGMAGQWYWGPLSFKVGRTRVLIKQHGGYDV